MDVYTCVKNNFHIKILRSAEIWRRVCIKRPTKTSVGHMETRPRLRASYNILEEREIELRTPGWKASGLQSHYNTATIYGYLPPHLIHAQIQEWEFIRGKVSATVLQFFINCSDTGSARHSARGFEWGFFHARLN